MERQLITRKQFVAAILVSLLSPLMRLLPQTAVRTAGRAAWLSAVPAALPLLALAFLMAAFRAHMRPGEGMGGLLIRWLGPVAGRIVLCLFGLWFLLYAGFTLSSGSERLVSTIYPNSRSGLFVCVTLLVCLLAALGTLRAVARAAVIIRGVLFGALAVVLVFSVPNADPGLIWPIGWEDGARVLLGAWPFATVGAVAACFSFLSGYVETPKGRVNWLIGPLFLLLALGGLICAEVVSVFGPALSVKLMYPFFVMIRNISIFNLVPRIEAVVIAVWVFADFMLCVMLLRCAHEALRHVFKLRAPENAPLFSLKNGRFLLWLEAAAVLGASLIFRMTPWAMPLWSSTLIPLISNIILFGGFPLLWLLSARKRKKGPGSGL